MKKTLFVFGMLLTGMLMTVNAEAQTAVYGGHNCVVWGGSGAIYSWANIGNSSASTLYVDCPVDNESPTTVESGWIKVQDQNNDAGGEITCAFYAVYQSGSDVWYWTNANGPQSSSGYGTNWQTLSFTSTSNSSSAATYYSCQIPKNDVGISFIGNYQVAE